jgi:hypothetical protein
MEATRIATELRLGGFPATSAQNGLLQGPEYTQGKDNSDWEAQGAFPVPMVILVCRF